jgi:hypothetical protein
MQFSFVTPAVRFRRGANVSATGTNETALLLSRGKQALLPQSKPERARRTRENETELRISTAFSCSSHVEHLNSIKKEAGCHCL